MISSIEFPSVDFSQTEEPCYDVMVQSIEEATLELEQGIGSSSLSHSARRRKNNELALQKATLLAALQDLRVGKISYNDFALQCKRMMETWAQTRNQIAQTSSLFKSKQEQMVTRLALSTSSLSKDLYPDFNSTRPSCAQPADSTISYTTLPLVPKITRLELSEVEGLVQERVAQIRKVIYENPSLNSKEKEELISSLNFYGDTTKDSLTCRITNGAGYAKQPARTPEERAGIAMERLHMLDRLIVSKIQEQEFEKLGPLTKESGNSLYPVIRLVRCKKKEEDQDKDWAFLKKKFFRIVEKVNPPPICRESVEVTSTERLRFKGEENQDFSYKHSLLGSQVVCETTPGTYRDQQERQVCYISIDSKDMRRIEEELLKAEELQNSTQGKQWVAKEYAETKLRENGL